MQEVRLKPYLPEGDFAVNRGGGWYHVPQNARVANRYYDDPGYRDNDLGVRLVRDNNQQGEHRVQDSSP